MVVRKITAGEILGGKSLIVSAGSPQGRLIKKYFEWETEWEAKLAKAREFAVKAHGGQRYGDRPYVEHLAEVVAVLTDFEYKAQYLCAGWLHDVVEDTPTTLGEIERNFGAEVARLVDAVSGGGDRESHVASIYEKIAAYPDAAIVKLADRIANVEACALGDKHAKRYAREHNGFAAAIQPHVCRQNWQRYERAANSRWATTIDSFSMPL